jgi:hypothetical protein
MRTFNPKKKVKIDILQSTHPAFDYAIWDINRCCYVHTMVDDNNISDLLDEKQFKQFQDGKSTFVVPADKLANQFSYLY